MKKIVLLAALLCASTIAMAENYEKINQGSTPKNSTIINYKLANGYFSDPGAKWDKRLEKILKEDRFFKKANEYLESKNKFLRKKVPSLDAESTNNKETVVYIPNYEKAIEEFKKSVEVYNNPVSAYEGIYIANVIYGKKGKGLKYFPIFAEVLHNNGLCVGHMYYAEVLEKGYFRKKDLAKALKVYKLTYNKKECKKMPFWMQSRIYGKIKKLEKVLKK